MTRRHNHTAQVVTAFVRIPEPLEPGKVRCNGCSKVVSLTKSGRTRRHRTPAGEDCAYVTVHAPKVALDELPPVAIPGPRQAPVAPPARRTLDDLVPDVASDARLACRSGECVDCGKWLPGERTLCGWCFVQRNQAKGRGA